MRFCLSLRAPDRNFKDNCEVRSYNTQVNVPGNHREVDAMNPNLFPAPRRITIRKNTVDLRQADWLVLPPLCSRRLRERIQESAARLIRI